jgi:hypothetical protein
LVIKSIGFSARLCRGEGRSGPHYAKAHHSLYHITRLLFDAAASITAKLGGSLIEPRFPPEGDPMAEAEGLRRAGMRALWQGGK